MSYGEVFPCWMEVYLEPKVFFPERWSWQSNTRLTWTPCWPTGRSSCRNLAGRRTIRDSCTTLKGWVIDTVCCAALIDASRWDGVFFQDRWEMLISEPKDSPVSKCALLVTQKQSLFLNRTHVKTTVCLTFHCCVFCLFRLRWTGIKSRQR